MEEEEKKDELSELLKNVKAAPPEEKVSDKKKKGTKKKYKKRFKEPLKKFEQCSDSELAVTIDSYIQKVTNQKLGISLEKGDVRIAGAAIYTAEYYNIEDKLPVDHPLVIVGIAMGLFGKGLITEVNKKKSAVVKDTQDHMQ